ncbi:MAG: hypothetical protein LKJ48_11410 [Lactobacillus sp.]|jgi:uncharacterized coiled-coil protein SlyX|nr:hypothetical protein [Lactobacillus sp.]
MAKGFDETIAALGQANDRLYRLEEVDYPTAAYKGFSAQGDTLAEVQDAIRETQATIRQLEERLDALNDQLD